MAIGDIKTFDIVYAGLTLQVNVIDLGGGQCEFSVKCISGFADINAVYWGDDVADGSNFDLGTKKDNSLNMNGTGADFDGGYKVSSTGLGPQGTDKPSYLTAGEELHFTSSVSWDDVDTLGVRATSTSTAGGSIKGVDGTSTVTEAPCVTIDDPTVTEGVNANATFTISLENAYAYDIIVHYSTADDSALDGSDYSAKTDQTVTILAGQTSATVSVAILDDNVSESPEQFKINITSLVADIPGDNITLPITGVGHENCDLQGVGTILDNDTGGGGGNPPADTVIAADDSQACGVEGLVKVTGNVLANDTDSLGHDLDVTQINGTDLSGLTPDGAGFYTIPIDGDGDSTIDGTLKINAETGDFEFTYTGAELAVGDPDWEGSFTYTVTDGDESNDSVGSSVYTATVDLCIDPAAASHGYWVNHPFTESEGAAGGGITVATSFDDYFNIDDPIARDWDIKVKSTTTNFSDLNFQQALDFNGDNNLNPDVTGGADLTREAATAVLNLYDADGHDAFVTAYEFQRGEDFADDAAVLADLKTQVEGAFEGTGVYTATQMADLLHLTHE